MVVKRHSWDKHWLKVGLSGWTGWGLQGNNIMMNRNGEIWHQKVGSTIIDYEINESLIWVKQYNWYSFYFLRFFFAVREAPGTCVIFVVVSILTLINCLNVDLLWPVLRHQTASCSDTPLIVGLETFLKDDYKGLQFHRKPSRWSFMPWHQLVFNLAGHMVSPGAVFM